MGPGIDRLGSGNVTRILTCNTRNYSRVSPAIMRKIDYVDAMAQSADDRGRAFAELIKAARKNLGYTQDEVLARSEAERPDRPLTKSTLVRWEGGRAERPEPDQVQLLCRILKIPPTRAAVALGYLTEADVRQPAGPDRGLSDEIEEVIDMLEDPHLAPAARAEWISYLRYLRDQRRTNGEHKRAAG